MKKSGRIGSLGVAALLTVVGLFVSGCYTPTSTVDSNGPRFYEEASANVVLRFYGWDHLFVVRPDFRDEGFLRPLKKDEIAPVLNVLNVKHDLAVVVMGWNYDRTQQQEIVSIWKDVLKDQGFRRIVWIKGVDDETLNGSPIVEDWRQAEVAPKRTAQL
jgi:hypothetical protein